MDKYLLIILMFMIAGMIIALTRNPEPVLFYASLGGAIIIIIYGSMKTRREQNVKRRENRRSKK